MDSIPIPCLPAARGPAGEIWAATAISTCGRVYGMSCSRASLTLNQSVIFVTASPRRSGMRTSSASSIMSRWRRGSMPIMKASEGSEPGPTPNMKRPFSW
jgi:hypothetical protein